MRAVREVDSLTPIIIGGDDWASAAGLSALEPFEENNVLYAVHMYEPFEFTNRKINAGRLCYPDDLLRDQPDTIVTGEDILRAILAPVSAWQLKHSVPSNQIVVEEFGCNRINCGAAGYIADIIAICNRNQWHWAFYAFREDTWDGMDYELGTKPPGWEYWKAVERGEPARLPRMDNPIWTAIRHGLRARDTTGAVR